jgi:hypothetical protein
VKSLMPLRLQSHRGGGTLLAALLTITTLSIAVGAFVSSVRNRSHIGFQSASWNQASLAAESAADAAVAEIRKVMPDEGAQTSGTWAGWTSSTGAVPAGTKIVAGTPLTLTPPPLTHGGEGIRRSGQSSRSTLPRASSPIIVNGCAFVPKAVPGSQVRAGRVRRSSISHFGASPFCRSEMGTLSLNRGRFARSR